MTVSNVGRIPGRYTPGQARVRRSIGASYEEIVSLTANSFSVVVTDSAALKQDSNLLQWQTDVEEFAWWDGSDYISIPDTGHTHTSLAVGCISFYNNASATSIAAANTWYQVLDFDTADVSQGVTASASDDHIQITTAGTYLILGSVAFSGATGDLIGFKIFKNNGATPLNQLYVHRELGATDVGVISLSGAAILQANDTIELWVENENDDDDVTCKDGNLTVVQIR